MTQSVRVIAVKKVQFYVYFFAPGALYPRVEAAANVEELAEIVRKLAKKYGRIEVIPA